ncbi:T9SS type A sorting domain-containing protein [Lewinella cohaerens]|uniref:T9SS type A sorting domain-containing protein n=1 Tax=Lewinella cohaerens TaxID=70995 RepID=UPI00037F23ED|nr:T9SS type A sorting domain-containing protein [Lewinella cohaerens]
MKPSLTFATLFLLLNITYSQKTYAPLHAEWKYEGFDVYCEGNHIKYTVTSEQFIDDKDCSWITGYQWSDEEMDWLTQDSLLVWENDHKVYFYEDPSFYLMYDFEAEAGDTVMSYDPVDRRLFSITGYMEDEMLPHLIPYYVITVGEIEINGVMYKTFVTPEEGIESCTTKSIIIEDIGSTGMGLTGETCFLVTMGCSGQFVCYNNGTVSYESGFLSCDSLTNVGDIPLKDEVKIYPNPASDLLHLDVPSSISIIGYVILDTAGRLLLVGEDISTIDISTLPKGVFYLKANLANGEVFLKSFLKQ